MIVTLLQQDIEWANPSANCLKAEGALLSATKSDLYVLPEMFSTGFATEPKGIAEANEESLHWMQRMAAQLDAAVAGSIATLCADGSYRNRFYFVKPDGSYSYYDKHHLFTYGGEHHRYTAGQDRVIVEWRDMRFLLLVCYDLRFPVWSRNHEEYDCALYVASWPTPRLAAWKSLLVARAIENQCYVCGVNRVGTDPACHYSGGTAVIDAYGKTIAACTDGEEGIITTELNMEQLTAFRTKFPVLKDTD